MLHRCIFKTSRTLLCAGVYLLAMLCSLALPVDRAAADELKPDPAQLEFFEKQVRPLLVENCFQCHSEKKQKGNLRLDSRHGMMSGGDSGPAIIPGQPDDSRLIQAIHYGDELQMPPKGKLNDEQIAVLTTWVKNGAVWPDAIDAPHNIATAPHRIITADDRNYWAFRPVIEPALPRVKNQAWTQSPIDQFTQATLESKSLQPVAAADKRALLRRASFDLVGLPPTPEELEAFEADSSPDAFAKVVDRLLESPHYGQRWARHWLDVARYGEDQAHTFQARKNPAGFRYRDWVIGALNRDLPYDQFLLEQIAADLLDEPNREERLPALGFFALGPVYYGKSTDDEIDDRIDTLCRGVLGLTVSCARCHDHKYDPIGTDDYYALSGVFASTEYKEWILKPDGMIDEEASNKPVDKDQAKKDKDAEKQGAAAKQNLIHALVDAAKPQNARIHIRGSGENLGDEIPRRFLAILSPDKPLAFQQGSGRLELARAIASRDNPLTARVIVNRVWMHHFGRGLVATAGNFGRLSDPPTHPELLDYLASRFMAEGWSLKKLHREIMLSATYQLGSGFDEHDAQIDPDNAFLWRANRRRLEIEPWRDAILAVSGRLDETLGGPSAPLDSPKNCRRSVYAAVSRHDLDPILRLFNFPDPNLTSERRANTLVPVQELFTLNSPLMLDSAAALAARITSDKNLNDDDARIRHAYRLVFDRAPSDNELTMSRKFLSEMPTSKNETPTSEAPSDDGSDSSKSDSSVATEKTPDAKEIRWRQFAHVLLSSNEFAFID
jgi:mono/diheme cytochrome c family protein